MISIRHSVASRTRALIPPLSSFMRRRLFSTSTETTVPATSKASSSAAASETSTTTLSVISRHGPEDSVITLNVGGKEFLTLRSTIAQNPVLYRHVCLATSNQEIVCTKNGAIFIDRDPTHFALILQHLRNKSDNISYSKVAYTGVWTHVLKAMTRLDKVKKKMVYVQLPEDPRQLRDLYLEAAYFELVELQNALCKANWMTALANMWSGGLSNPFDQAQRGLILLRRGLLATGAGLGTTFMTDLNALPEWLGLKPKQKKKDESVREKNMNLVPGS